MTTANLRATGQARFALDRALVRRIVDSGAEGQDCHLEVVFADGSAHHATPVGEPDITIVFRHRRAQWRMAFGGVFEFLESYFNGDVEIVGEHGLRPRGIGLISATFNMRARPTNYCTIKHIFPGGFIPGLAQTLLLMEKHGLNLLSIENRSYHYHRTVEQWLKNFEANWERIRAIDPVLFSEKFRRSWLFYLGGAAETFEAEREIINCFHITFVKGHSAEAPPR